MTVEVQRRGRSTGRGEEGEEGEEGGADLPDWRRDFCQGRGVRAGRARLDGTTPETAPGCPPPLEAEP